MVPLVLGHEKRSAVPRVVIAVRSQLRHELPLAAVSTLARIAEILVRLFSTGPVLRHDHLNELALVNRTLTPFVADDGGVIWARPRRIDAHRDQVHSADGATSGLRSSTSASAGIGQTYESGGSSC